MKRKQFISKSATSLILLGTFGAVSTCLMTTVRAFATTNPDYIKPVISVNGNSLVKEQPILAGDTVTWDVINTPGNTGLVTSVKDTLPTGLAFNPKSKNTTTLTSNAKVYTPKYNKPTIIKQESKDGGVTWYDDLTLKEKDDNYLYRIVVAIPPHTADEEFSILDDMENIVSADDVKLYYGQAAWIKGTSDVKDVTSDFNITERKGSDFTVDAKDTFIKLLRAEKDTSFVTLVTHKTNLSKASQAQIDKYDEGEVPNTASAVLNDKEIKSNKVLIKVKTTDTPEPPVTPEIPEVPEVPEPPLKVDVHKYIKFDDGKVNLDDKVWTDQLTLPTTETKYDYHVDYSFNKDVTLDKFEATDNFEAIQDLQGVEDLKMYLTDAEGKTSDVTDKVTFTNPTKVEQAEDGKKENATIEATFKSSLNLKKGDTLSFYLDNVTWKSSNDVERKAYNNSVDNVAGANYQVQGDTPQTIKSNVTNVKYSPLPEVIVEPVKEIEENTPAPLKPVVNLILPHTGDEVVPYLAAYGFGLIGLALGTWKRKTIKSLFGSLFTKVASK